MVFPDKVITLLFSWHCDFTLDSVIPPRGWVGGLTYTPRSPEGSKDDLHGKLSTLAHSQRSNFQPVLGFKHTSNPTCFPEIRHALKIQPCSAAVLEWDQRAPPILHQTHWTLFTHFSWQNACLWIEFWVCFLASVCLICCPLSFCLQTCSPICASPPYNIWGLCNFPEEAPSSSKSSCVLVFFSPV